MEKDTREKPGATCFNSQGTADAICILKVNPGSPRTRFSKISKGQREGRPTTGRLCVDSIWVQPNDPKVARAQMWLEGDAAAGGGFKMEPSPGDQEAWTRRLQGSRLVSEGFPDSRLKFQQRERRRRQRASRHPNLTQPTSPRSPLPRCTSSEVTVPLARGVPRTELHR